MFDRNIAELDKTLPIIYWLLKMHKTLIGARCIVASKKTTQQSHSLMQYPKFSKCRKFP